MQGGIAVGALVIVGAVLVALGVFAAGSFQIMAPGVASLIAAGLFEVLAQRR